jgi:hypothetical protein
MLSPKMQRSVRVNENQLIMLSDKAQHDNSMVSIRHEERKRNSINSNWIYPTLLQHSWGMSREKGKKENLSEWEREENFIFQS